MYAGTLAFLEEDRSQFLGRDRVTTADPGEVSAASAPLDPISRVSEIRTLMSLTVALWTGGHIASPPVGASAGAGAWDRRVPPDPPSVVSFWFFRTRNQHQNA